MHDTKAAKQTINAKSGCQNDHHTGYICVAYVLVPDSTFWHQDHQRTRQQSRYGETDVDQADGRVINIIHRGLLFTYLNNPASPVAVRATQSVSSVFPYKSLCGMPRVYAGRLSG